jgi:hypothetical protein
LSRKKDGASGEKARIVGWVFTVVLLKVMSKSWHCSGARVMVYREVCAVVVDRQLVLLEGCTWIMSEVLRPVGLPLASSREARNVVSAARGRKVTATPVAVVAFHESSGMIMAIGEALKGTMVNWSGRASGATPPLKETVKAPHWSMGEKVICSKSPWTTSGPRAKTATKALRAVGITLERPAAK